jgi:hypothetical protein
MKNNTKTLTLEQLDQINEIQHCLSAVAALMIPCEDLHVVNRDNLAILMGYLTDRLREATQGAV